MFDKDRSAFIFDLDGTLIDTEKLYRKYWPMALKDYGYDLSDERALMLRSLGRPFAPRQFKDWYGEDFDYNLVRQRRKEYVEGHIEKYGISLRPGVKEILTFLKEKNITVAIATATDLERTKKYLDMTGISPLPLPLRLVVTSSLMNEVILSVLSGRSSGTYPPQNDAPCILERLPPP